MIVEVFGPEPPCPRCMRTLEIVKQVVNELQLNCEVKKIDAYSKAIIARYGLVLTPAVAINGRVFIAGRIPSVEEVKRILNVTANFKDVEQNDFRR
jgi:small redox-active disulfide protein 2